MSEVNCDFYGTARKEALAAMNELQRLGVIKSLTEEEYGITFVKLEALFKEGAFFLARQVSQQEKKNHGQN